MKVLVLSCSLSSLLFISSIAFASITEVQASDYFLEVSDAWVEHLRDSFIVADVNVESEEPASLLAYRLPEHRHEHQPGFSHECEPSMHPI